MFLELKNLQKLFDSENGVKNINMEIEDGEFITILGPSGCGKTTILNLIGGFLKADSGKILLDGLDITNIPPEQRPISTVFQSYALFPHMNVIENISFGIRFYRNVKKKKAIEMAKKYVEIVGLTGYEATEVGNLSGGQQQRVALARAMATNPKILLLDEPLSNLDTNLRIKMRQELKELQKRLNITMILVTHDQGEALCLSDKIVVMSKGEIVQVGSPRDIYFYPQNEYVSSFIGKTNIYKEDGKSYFVRPENIKLKIEKEGNYRVIKKLFMGSHTEYVVSDGKNNLEVNIAGMENMDISTGDTVELIIEHKILASKSN